MPRFSQVEGSTGRKTGRAAPEATGNAERLLPVLLNLPADRRPGFLADQPPELQARLLELLAAAAAGGTVPLRAQQGHE